jgi:PKD repeat protein
MRRFFLVWLFSLIAWSACSGLVERPSAVVTTSPKDVTVGTVVGLDGSNSSDPGGRALSYAWQMVQLPLGSTAELANASLSKTTFVADKSGDYKVSLVVSNDMGASDPTIVTITVLPCGGNAPVIDSIKATPDKTQVGKVAALAATVSHPDEKPPCTAKRTLSYDWQLGKRPAGSKATVAQPSSSTPSLTPDVVGDYEVTLVVTDDLGHKSAPKSVTVTAGVCGSQAPSASIKASSDAPNIGQTVQLDATATDPDTDPACAIVETFSFAWTLVAIPAGSKATLSLPTTKNPSIVIDTEGAYTVRVITTDAAGHASKAAEHTITASKCGGAAPVVESIASAPTAPGIDKPAMLTATVKDADNDAPCNDPNKTFQYLWKLLSLPAGSKATFNQVATDSPSFTPDVPGDYTVGLVVTDAAGHKSAEKSLLLKVGSCGANEPVISSISANPSVAPANQDIVLSAAVSDADLGNACPNTNEVLSYQWWIASAAKGSVAKLDQPSAVSPTFKADVAGSYTIALVVTDAQGHKTAPKLQAFSTTDCGSTPPQARVFQVGNSSGKPVLNFDAGLVAVDSIVQMSGGESFDPDNQKPCSAMPPQALTFSWSMLELPFGASTTLNNDSVVNPSFQAKAVGKYVIGLIVTDSTGRKSTMATFTVRADPAVNMVLPAGFKAGSIAFRQNGVDKPRGITVDTGTKTIYLVEGGADLIHKIQSGVISVFSSGNKLVGGGGPIDIAFQSGANNLFVSAGDKADNLVRIDATGAQSDCSPNGSAKYTGLQMYTTVTGKLRLIANNRQGKRVELIDPANCTLDKSNDFTAPTDAKLNDLSGVAAVVVDLGALGKNDDLFIADRSTKELWRNRSLDVIANSAPPTSLGKNDKIGSGLDDPHEVVTTPCNTAGHPKLLVANTNKGNIELFANAQASPTTVFASGLKKPYGLAFEDANNLLVTDESLNVLIRITGDFCGL